MDYDPKAAVSYDLALSDHFAIEGSFRISEQDISVRRWPPPLDLSWGQVMNPPWNTDCRTYAQWCERATAWLAEAYAVPKVNKTACHVTPFSPPSPSVDHHYKAILSAQKALTHVMRVKKVSQAQLASLSRKLHALNILSLDWREAQLLLDAALEEHINNLSQHAIKRWKERVSHWTVQSRELFAFLKNEPPTKAAVLLTPEGITACPSLMHKCLSEFWGGLEAWPSSERRELAWERLRDHYCLFLPFRSASVQWDHKLLYQVVKNSRRSSAGPDGWTIHEAKALPSSAWKSLLEVLKQGWEPLAKTLLLAYKRVPIEKGCAIAPLPSSLRPIDVFSVVLRSVARMHTASLIDWKVAIIHEGQHATHGGTPPALARMTALVERVRRNHGKWWCLTIDFSKLYNMIDPGIVGEVMRCMGLSASSADDMMKPIQMASG